VIIINVDVMLARRKMSVTELAERVGFTMANISMIKNGKVKALKISTLEKLCEALDCQPGDILEYQADNTTTAATDTTTASADQMPWRPSRPAPFDL
jgi:putative transcriptional regulator